MKFSNIDDYDVLVSTPQETLQVLMEDCDAPQKDNLAKHPQPPDICSQGFP